MSKSKPFIITGKHVFAGFVLFFGTIIAVNIAFVSLAGKSFPGETVDDPYEKGIHYNETLAARELAINLGWKITYSVTGSDGADNQFLVKIVDETGPLDGLQVEINLKWSGIRDADTVLILTPVGKGIYQSPLAAHERPEGAASFIGLAVRVKDGAKMTFVGQL